MAYEQNFKVLNMNCNHCVNTITKALRAIKGIDDVAFNLEDKNVKVSGDVSAKLIIDTITEAGYKVKE
jgi:copper chaperone